MQSNIHINEQFFVVKGDILRYPLRSQIRCEFYGSPKITYNSISEKLPKHVIDHTKTLKYNTLISKKLDITDNFDNKLFIIQHGLIQKGLEYDFI